MMLNDIAVGVIINKKGQVLCTQRSMHSSMPLIWEFPGGKIETGESKESALIRELHEELGIEIIDYQYLFSIDNTPHLHIFKVCHYNGQPSCREGQADMKWLYPLELQFYTFPKANSKIQDWLITNDFSQGVSHEHLV